MSSISYEKKRNTKEWIIAGSVLFVFLIIIPLLNTLPGENSWFRVSSFRLNLLGKFCCFAILALGLNLAWGYTGILSLGQGVYFGLGGYCMAMYLILKVGVSGHYESALPDFMVWNGLTELPWFWKPMNYAWIAIPCVVIVPMALAGGFGYMLFRSRVRGVYFAIVTQALSLVLAITLVGNQPYTGGTNGLNDFRSIFGLPLRGPDLPRTEFILYIATIIILFGAYLLCRWITRSKLGKVLVAIRDDENRVRFSGYDVANFKIFIFMVAAGLAGLGGALFVPQVGIIAPANVGIVPSIEMTLWVAVGGRGTLVGPVIGAILVNSAKSAFSESFPSIWLYFLGALFLGVVVLFPKGIIDIPNMIKRVWRKKQKQTGTGVESVNGVEKSNEISGKVNAKKTKVT
ncbi:MAG: urea ABC transporter permease subunit UrtC [Candidatus Scalindua sp.]|nr:urea ABC transporter permease subunit UrtC [Candidatus Scalindua sp.]